ncbi:SWI/SNF-related matrix-associated actin-dependent regulator of chromatin subfamily E member 1-related-like [Brevipalpus obovatus]|uniref:SWI/SNF-related matrix-associated actin-dependent regulator of chromatin subfamily E member 1-related-like n=1 Tax=Brevipalpus obovatus TaxID=246614 RepID=UPI003D9EF1E5
MANGDQTLSSAPLTDIPIFTDHFLDHNKALETELRKLRASITENEEQTALLNKYIENIKSTTTKLEGDLIREQNTNSKLKNYLGTLRNAIISEFQVPHSSQDNLEEYLQGLVNKVKKSKTKERDIEAFQEKVKRVMLQLHSETTGKGGS